LSNRVAVITQTLLRKGKGGRLSRVKATYLGFDDFETANQAAKQIKAQYPKIQISLRPAKRLKTKFELKVRGNEAEQIAWDALKAMPTTSQRVERHLKVVATRPSLAPDAPVLPRHTGRTLVTTSCGRAIGID
jgi:hypothetical protein